MNRETNPFWQSLMSAMDEQFACPTDAVPWEAPDPAEAKRIRLELERMKRRNLEQSA